MLNPRAGMNHASPGVQTIHHKALPCHRQTRADRVRHFKDLSLYAPCAERIRRFQPGQTAAKHRAALRLDDVQLGQDIIHRHDMRIPQSINRWHSRFAACSENNQPRRKRRNRFHIRTPSIAYRHAKLFEHR